jgi:hypothetical protein
MPIAISDRRTATGQVDSAQLLATPQSVPKAITLVAQAEAYTVSGEADLAFHLAR